MTDDRRTQSTMLMTNKNEIHIWDLDLDIAFLFLKIAISCCPADQKRIPTPYTRNEALIGIEDPMDPHQTGPIPLKVKNTT